MLADCLRVLEGFLFSYKDTKPIDYESDEQFVHGLGCHIQAIGIELGEIFDGLYGKNGGAA